MLVGLFVCKTTVGIILYLHACVFLNECVCVCATAHACMLVCMRACVCVCVHACAGVFQLESRSLSCWNWKLAGLACDWALTLAPFSTSTRMISSWPAKLAMCRGVLPFCDQRKTSSMKIWQQLANNNTSGQCNYYHHLAPKPTPSRSP